MSVLPVWEYILRLILSALFGGAIGLEREFRLKEAGVRTHLIVSFASCLMMLVSKYGFYDMLEYSAVKLDPSRVAAGIVAGIGFLGAGTIFSRGRNVTGLTTAAGLWATVGIGMAVGSGMYLISTFGAVFIVAIQAVLHWNLSFLSHSGVVVSIQLEDQPDALEQLHEALAQLELRPSNWKYERLNGVVCVELEIDRLPCSSRDLGKLFLPLIQAAYIKSIDW